MKWIENGISFEGSVSEFKELHADGIPAPVRTRKGKSITVVNTDGAKVLFETLKDAAAYITAQTGRFVSPSHLGSLNGATVELASFAPGKEIPLFKPEETPELPTASSVDAVPGSAPEQDELPAAASESNAESAPASAN